MPMSPAPGRRSLAGRRAALLLLLTLLLTPAAACRAWRAEPLPAAGAPVHAGAGHTRLTRADGSQVELARARVEGDTLRAELYEIPRGRGPVAVAVPLDSVRRLEARRFSPGRTAALAGGLILVYSGLGGFQAW